MHLSVLHAWGDTVERTNRFFCLLQQFIWKESTSGQACLNTNKFYQALVTNVVHQMPPRPILMASKGDEEGKEQSNGGNEEIRHEMNVNIN